MNDETEETFASNKTEAARLAGWGLSGLIQSKIAHFLLGVLSKLAGAAIVALIALSPWCVTQIKDYDLVVLRKWGKRVEGEIPPGLKWYWPVINTVHRYDGRPRTIKIDAKDETSKLSGIPTVSREGWQVGVITDINYKLSRHMWQEVDDNFGSDDTAETRRQIEERIRIVVRHAVQNLMPQYYLEYLLTHRGELRDNCYVFLGLTDQEKRGTQTQVAVGGKVLPIEVTVKDLVPTQRLNELGIEIKDLAIQFETLPEYDAMQKKNAADREMDRVANEKITELQNQQRISSERAKLDKMEAESKADVEATLLLPRQKVSTELLFVEKWDGKLPQVFAGSGKSESLVGDIIGNSAAEKFAGNQKTPHTPLDK